MKKGQGKRKGSEYERKISKLLGEWLYNDIEVFWRSAGSGSTKMKEHQGDIVSIKPEGKELTDKYVIECKNVKNVDIFKFINNEKDIMRKWVNQVEREIEVSGNNKDFLLIFHQHNSSNDYILMKYNKKTYNLIKFSKIVIFIEEEKEYMMFKLSKENIKILIKEKQ